jgi:hypothetical protein
MNIRDLQSVTRARGVRSSGYSLVELLAVTAVVLLALGLALPGIAQMHSRSQRLSAAEEFQRIIWRGRVEALQRGVMVGIHFERLPDASYRYQMFKDGNANGITAADRLDGHDPALTPPLPLFTETGFRPQLPPATAPAVPPEQGGFTGTDAIALSGDTLSFSPQGSFSNGSIYLGNGREYLCLRFAGNLGRKRIYRWKPGQFAWLEVLS